MESKSEHPSALAIRGIRSGRRPTNSPPSIVGCDHHRVDRLSFAGSIAISKCATSGRRKPAPGAGDHREALIARDIFRGARTANATIHARIASLMTRHRIMRRLPVSHPNPLARPLSRCCPVLRPRLKNLSFTCGEIVQRDRRQFGNKPAGARMSTRSRAYAARA